jgi:hypothetical protein
MFGRQAVDSVKEAVEHFELHRREIMPAACQQNAMRFSSERFNREIAEAFEIVRRQQR